jgi:hypothetical protein
MYIGALSSDNDSNGLQWFGEKPAAVYQVIHQDEQSEGRIRALRPLRESPGFSGPQSRGMTLPVQVARDRSQPLDGHAGRQRAFESRPQDRGPELRQRQQVLDGGGGVA